MRDKTAIHIIEAILNRRVGRPIPKLRLSISFGQLKFIGVNKMFLTTEQRVTAAILAATALGAVARLDGTVLWSVSDPAVATIDPSEDGKSVIIKAAGLGQTIVTAQVDADLDDGETRLLTAMLDITVVEPEAVTLGLEVGEPELNI